MRVHQKIKDINQKGEEKERVQIFEGIVIATKHGTETGATFTVRRETKEYGVEKIFPLHSPVIAKVEVVRQFRTRRAKLYFLRDKNFKRKLMEAR